MAIKIAYSIKTDPFVAAEEIHTAAVGMKPTLVLFFASSIYNSEDIADAMGRAFPDTNTAGCSTAGELTSGKMLHKSLVAMIIERDIIDSISASPLDLNHIDGAVKVVTDLAATFNKTPIDLNPEDYTGLILIDGMSGAEESVMEKIGDITDITIIGGSAGDDLAFAKTHIYFNGRVYDNSALILLLKMSCSFDFIKTQSFCGTGIKLIPTKVDKAERMVKEFNNESATVAYGKAVGTDPSKVADVFMKHPVGLISDEGPFVRSPQKVDGNSIRFFCQIIEGLELELLKSTDIIEDTKKAIDEMEKKHGKIKGLINFNCILRTLELEQTGRSEEYGKLFADIPTVGFSTYGEEYIGHINQTATMLVFF